MTEWSSTISFRATVCLALTRLTAWKTELPCSWRVVSLWSVYGGCDRVHLSLQTAYSVMSLLRVTHSCRYIICGVLPVPHLTCVSASWLGPAVFRGKFCQILWATSRDSAADRGKIVQIPQLAMVSRLWLRTERAVQKLQLLKAGIVLNYVSNIKGKSFFFLF